MLTKHHPISGLILPLTSLLSCLSLGPVLIFHSISMSSSEILCSLDFPPTIPSRCLQDAGRQIVDM